MRIPRFYHPAPLASQQLIRLTEEASHHCRAVLRMEKQQTMHLFHNDDAWYEGTIASIDRHHVHVLIGARHVVMTESPCAIHLGQSISRRERMDYAIQKSVELGVAAITPLITEHSELGHEPSWQKRLDRWRLMIMNACEQCGRTRLPQLHEPIALRDWLLQRHEELKIVLHPESTPSSEALPKIATQIALCIGPIAGLSDVEVSLAVEHGFIPVRLGPRILRTETAPVAALAVLQARYGDIYTFRS